MDIGKGAWMKYLDYLDWRLKLSLNPGDRLCELSKRFDINCQISISIHESELEVYLAFKNNQQYSRDFIIFFNDLGAVIDDDMYRIRYVVNVQPEFLAMLREIVAVPTSVLISSHIQKGVYYMDFIFNRNEVSKISRSIMGHLDSIKNMSIRYIGPSGGFLNAIHEINQRTPLTVSETRIIPPDYEVQHNSNPMGDNWVRIIKIPFGMEEPLGIYFVNESPKQTNDIEAVVQNSIYTGRTNNSLSKFLNNENKNQQVPSIFSIQTYFKPHYISWNAFPTMFHMEQFRLIMQTRREMPEWKPVLRRMQPFGQWFKEIV